jgi:hypothetical protein
MSLRTTLYLSPAQRRLVRSAARSLLPHLRAAFIACSATLLRICLARRRGKTLRFNGPSTRWRSTSASIWRRSPAPIPLQADSFVASGAGLDSVALWIGEQHAIGA